MDLGSTVLELWGIWLRPISTTYVSRDLPRLLKNIVVRESIPGVQSNPTTTNIIDDEKKMYKETYPNGEKPTEIGLINQLIGLVNSVKSEKEEKMTTEDVEQFLNSASHMQTQKLVKFFDQAYSISFLSTLALHLMKTAKLRFLDSRGDWWIFIQKEENSFSFLSRRTEFLVEQPDFVTLNRICRFTWDLKISFDSFDMKHFKHVTARLVGIETTGTLTPAQNEKIKILADSFQNLDLDNIGEDFLKKKSTSNDKVILSTDASDKKKSEYGCNI